jgi:hypothetical protein
LRIKDGAFGKHVAHRGRFSESFGLVGDKRTKGLYAVGSVVSKHGQMVRLSRVLLDRPFHQFVLDAEDYADYRQGLFELLTGLAEFEGRQASEVIDDVLLLAGQRQDGNGAAVSPSAPVETTH